MMPSVVLNLLLYVPSDSKGTLSPILEMRNQRSRQVKKPQDLWLAKGRASLPISAGCWV